MKVYHGSHIEVSIIDLTKCESGKDFGKAFYVTKFREQAEHWAKRKGKENNTNGFITEYNFYENAFDKFHLNVLRFDSYSEEWLDFVVENRKPDASPHDYDLVEGPVANDDITQRIFAYLDGKITKKDFLEELKFKYQPSHQIAFCTVASLQMLEWIKRESDIYKYTISDDITHSLVKDYSFTVEEAIDKYFSSNTYKQLTDETTGLYQKPSEYIYNMLKQELKKDS
jgi:hypothetical protein